MGWVTTYDGSQKIHYHNVILCLWNGVLIITYHIEDGVNLKEVFQKMSKTVLTEDLFKTS